MMGLGEDMAVTLVIKAPNQRMADQTVECSLTWTIKKLKQHLESVYPSKPKLNEQRLIYSGKLLQDHLTLKEILRQYDSTEVLSRHTVHLVCPAQPDPTPTQQSDRNASSSSSSPSSSSTPASQPDGLRHRATAASSSSNSNADPSVSGATAFQPQAYSAYPPMMGQPMEGYTPEQYAAMMQQQQLYSQYMMQYMQYYQSAFYPYQSFNPQAAAYFPQAFVPTGFPANPPAAGAQPQAAPAVGADQPLPRAGPARQNVRMNAQGGMEEDEEDDGEPRDWLHHTYFFMRFLTFMGILFFYSNLTRFLAVFSGSCAIYFLQNLRKYLQARERERQRQAAEANNQENAANQQQPQQQQQQDGQNEANPLNAQPAQDLPDGQQQQQQQEQQPTEEQQQQQVPAAGQVEAVPEQGKLTRMFVFACNTIQTFFTSLVPAPPELLDAN